MSSLGVIGLRLGEIADKLRVIGEEFKNKCRVRDPECDEDNFRAKFDDVLYREALEKLGIPRPAYEYHVATNSGSKLIARHYRIDAYYGLVFFEYKLPRTEDIPEAAEEQVREYIMALRNDERTKKLIDEISRKGFKPIIVGIITNGLSVVFVKYDVEMNQIVREPQVGSRRLDEDAVRDMIRYIIGAWKRRLDAHILSAEFGYQSPLMKEAVAAFYRKLKNVSGRPSDFYNEWLNQISIVYPEAGAEVARLAHDYGIEDDNIDGSKLFFAIQTYYSLILKFLAAEVASRFYDSIISSFIRDLKSAAVNEESLKNRLEILERGGPTAWYGIYNLLEGQLFSWYLDVWDKDVYKVVKNIVDKLSEFDIESLEADPGLARDVFKVLYEELVPRREIRRKLGIYTTPDWLAELILDELGLTVGRMKELGKDDPLAPFRIKVLDPGVGTGTFLVLYIQRLGIYLKERINEIPPSDRDKIYQEALRLITRNVVGFDVDALALLTARVNYLIALAAAGLLQHKGGRPIEIPIYMANSVAPAEYMRDKVLVEDVSVSAVKVHTSLADFILPASILSNVRDVLDLLTDYLNKEVPSPKVEEGLGQFFSSRAEVKLMRQFYEKLLELKRDGRDSVWLHVIKSYLVPNAYIGMFDYIVGNPPWLTYNKLSASYQEVVKPMIKDRYNLTTESELITHMEMATLFFVRSIDLYLRDGGRIGFVMPRTLFDADQHSNFRTGNVTGVRFGIDKVIDANDVEPLFYFPACAIIASKGGGSRSQIPALILSGKLPEERYKTMPLSDALNYLTKREGQLYLIEQGGRTAWSYQPLKVPRGRSYYFNYFREGATIVPRPLFFIEVMDISGDLVIVKPARRTERREAKVKFDIPQSPVEKQFIYGVLTSNELIPFYFLRPALAILPIRSQGNAYAILRADMLRQLGYSNVANWMERAEELWNRYRGEKRERMDIYQRLNYSNGLTAQNPNAKYRVVYNTSGTHLTAAVVEVGKRDIETGVGKVEVSDVIIDYTLFVYHTNNKDEANYLAAILNSNVLDELVKPLQAKGEFGERHFVKKPLEFPIPKYDPNQHSDLAELGERAREQVKDRLDTLLKELGLDQKLRTRYYLTPQEVGRLRIEVRKMLNPIITKIDERVKQLLETRAKDSNILNFIG